MIGCDGAMKKKFRRWFGYYGFIPICVFLLVNCTIKVFNLFGKYSNAIFWLIVGIVLLLYTIWVCVFALTIDEDFVGFLKERDKILKMLKGKRNDIYEIGK